MHTFIIIQQKGKAMAVSRLTGYDLFSLAALMK